MANMSRTTHPSRGRSSGTPVQVFGGSPSCLTRPFAARAPGGGGPGDLRKVAALPAEEDTTPLHSLGRSDPSRYNSRAREEFLNCQTRRRATEGRTDGRGRSTSYYREAFFQPSRCRCKEAVLRRRRRSECCLGRKNRNKPPRRVRDLLLL